jgi:hypothetical protein
MHPGGVEIHNSGVLFFELFELLSPGVDGLASFHRERFVCLHVSVHVYDLVELKGVVDFLWNARVVVNSLKGRKDQDSLRIQRIE